MSTYYFVTFESSANRYEGRPKFKYLLPLDDEIAERIKLFQTVSETCDASRDILRQTPVWRGRASTERGAPSDTSHQLN